MANADGGPDESDRGRWRYHRVPTRPRLLDSLSISAGARIRCAELYNGRELGRFSAPSSATVVRPGEVVRRWGADSEAVAIPGRQGDWDIIGARRAAMR
jgi:hypothetical protein